MTDKCTRYGCTRLFDWEEGSASEAHQLCDFHMREWRRSPECARMIHFSKLGNAAAALAAGADFVRRVEAEARNYQGDK